MGQARRKKLAQQQQPAVVERPKDPAPPGLITAPAPVDDAVHSTEPTLPLTMSAMESQVRRDMNRVVSPASQRTHPPVKQLEAIERLRWTLDFYEVLATRAALRDRVSFETIGEVRGVSRSAAHQRFGALQDRVQKMTRRVNP